MRKGVDVSELDIKLINGIDLLFHRLLLVLLTSLLEVLAVVEMQEDMGQLLQDLNLFVRVVVPYRLVITGTSHYADQTEPVNVPLPRQVPLFIQTRTLQQTLHLTTAQLHYRRIVYLPQLLLKFNYDRLFNLNGNLTLQ
jgi:hypothetical protein